MTDYRPPTRQPCSDCPFRRKAMPGWLGSGSPESFVDCMNRDEPLPCHQTIDYDDPNWLVKWSAQENGSMCAGALIFMANKLQRPRSAGFPTLPQDKAAVFANTVEFVRYHREAGTHSWNEDDQNDGAKLQRELIQRGAQATGQPIVDHRNARKPLDNSDLNALLATAARGPVRGPLPLARAHELTGRRRDERIPLQNVPTRKKR